MGLLLRAVIRTMGGALRRSFDRAARDPQRAQLNLLLKIVGHNALTEYGQEHGFRNIRDARAFADAVPVNTFLDLAGYIDRMKKGERNVLTADQPFMFNLTSGTTDKPKYLPITQRGQELTAQVSRQWLNRALLDHPAFLDHGILIVTGAAVEGRTSSGIPYGSASGMVYKTLPRVLRRSFVLPFMLSELADYELRYYLMARLALEQEVSFLATPNPTTLVAIAEAGRRHQEEIVRSVHDGVLSQTWPFERCREDLRILEQVEGHLRANPSRAEFLRQVIRRHGELLPSACWKHLKLMGCWLGGSVGFQADKLAARYGEGVPVRDIGYLASEGSITIPHEDGTPAGILALQNCYYEFIPDQEGPAPGARSLQCHELELGRQYRIILTNWNGLYRYDIHDIVEVHGFYHRTPVIAFVRKGEDMLNMTGEKLHANHFTAALRRVDDECGVSAIRFRVVPNLARVRYEILMQVGPEVSAEILKRKVLPCIDRALCEVNVEYDAKRKSTRLGAPCIHVMDPAWEVSVRRHHLQSGRRDMQSKWQVFATEMSELDAGHVRLTIEM